MIKEPPVSIPIYADLLLSHAALRSPTQTHSKAAQAPVQIIYEDAIFECMHCVARSLDCRWLMQQPKQL